jgi:ribose transport system permease protein
MTARTAWRPWQHVNPAVVVLLALVVAMSFLSPLYRTPGGLMMLLQRAAPLVVLACGQTFVLAAGGFDLSVGSIVTLVVTAAPC